MKNTILTPEGFRDVLGRECKARADMINRMKDVVCRYGYSQIDPPSFEYLSCFAGDVGSTPENELYRVFDNEGNTLALRADFTPSIARVAAKYFSGSGVPIKLFYSGSVFKNLKSHSGRLKENMQLGAEYIGDSSVDADAEIIAMAVDCLKCANVTSFSISINHAGILEGLCQALNLDFDSKEELRTFLSKRNYARINNFINEHNIPRDLLRLIRGNRGILTEVSEINELIDSLGDYKIMKESLMYLRDLLALLDAYGIKEYVNIDLSLMSSYRYYTGVMFYGYTYGLGNAVLSGGRYDKLLSRFGKEAPAMGFAILCDDLLEAESRQGVPRTSYEVKDVILYEAHHRVEAIKNAGLLRARGKSVQLVRYEGPEDLEKQKRIYFQDNVFLITDGSEDE